MRRQCFYEIKICPLVEDTKRAWKKLSTTIQLWQCAAHGCFFPTIFTSMGEKEGKIVDPRV